MITYANDPDRLPTTFIISIPLNDKKLEVVHKIDPAKDLQEFGLSVGSVMIKIEVVYLAINGRTYYNASGTSWVFGKG